MESDDEGRASAVNRLATEGLARAQDEPRNVARTCRHFGISRKAFYKWKRRYDRARRRRPVRPAADAAPVAARHAAEVVSKILYLRQHYHFGPGRIAAYLQAVSPGLDRGLVRASDLGASTA